MTKYLVRATVPRTLAEEWVRWLHEEHFPAMTALPWFSSAHVERLEMSAGPSTVFISIYDSPSPESLQKYFDSEECVRLRGEFQSKFGSSVEVVREVWNPVGPVGISQS